MLAVLIPGTAAAVEFQAEPTGQAASLNTPYPGHWILVHDASFYHMLEGQVLIVDPLAASTAGQYKGMLTASFMANVDISPSGNEIYVLETFFSRGGRGGERSDFLTIWDAATLTVSGEVPLPPKRLSSMPERFAASLLGDGRYFVVYNFDPAQTVSVVDLQERRFVQEVPIPGCALVFPTGARAFTSICSNGGLVTHRLNRRGEPDSTVSTAPFIDIAGDALFEKPAIIDGVAYFPTFAGNLQPVDLRRDTPVPKDAWAIDPSRPDWRPGGWQLVATDDAGLIYLLMHPDGAEGTHKDGGSEVWVIDPAKRSVVDRIELVEWGVSLATTGAGDGRLLIVTNANMQLDVYRIPDRSFVHTLSLALSTPFVVHGVR